MSNEIKKQEAREKARKKCIKILNVTCYIGTFLLILILLLTGLQSCKQNKGYSSVSAEVPTQVENLARTQWHFKDDIGEVLSEYSGTISFNVDFETMAGTHYNYLTIDWDYVSYKYGLDGEPYWAYDVDYGWDGLSGQTITFYADFNSVNYDNSTLIQFLNKSATLVKPLTTFTFNENYNYNAPLGLNVGITGLPFMNDLAWVNTNQITPPSTATETTATLLLFPFYSNGILYNVIKSHYQIARSNYSLYTEDNEGKVIKVQNNLPVYDYMSFAYIESGATLREDIVNIRNTTTAQYDNASVTAYENGTTWVNDGFRRLNFSGYVLTGELSTRMTAFNNNNEITIYTDDSALSNTFELFAGVFTAIVPFLSIQILPSLTIGLFIFIPLITAVIFFIIDKIKK